MSTEMEVPLTNASIVGLTGRTVTDSKCALYCGAVGTASIKKS